MSSKAGSDKRVVVACSTPHTAHGNIAPPTKSASACRAYSVTSTGSAKA
jgi:hypothetical protein